MGMNKYLPLTVTDHSEFTIDMTLLEDPNDDDGEPRMLLIGIAPFYCTNRTFCVRDDSPEHGFFIDDCFNLWAEDGTDDCLMLNNTFKVGNIVRIGYSSEPSASMSMTIMTPAGEFESETMKFKSTLPKNYCPFIVIRKRGFRLQIKEAESKSKRQAFAYAILANMWEKRSFTDAVIVCHGRSLQVHREVLVAASPVLAAAFTGEM